MDERQPHRPNYAELNKAHEEAQQREPQQEAVPEPTRPDRVRSGAAWAQDPGLPAQEKSAIERNNELNPPLWKQMARNPELAQKVQQQFDEQKNLMLQKEDGHLPPDGHERS